MKPSVVALHNQGDMRDLELHPMRAAFQNCQGFSGLKPKQISGLVINFVIKKNPKPNPHHHHHNPQENSPSPKFYLELAFFFPPEMPPTAAKPQVLVEPKHRRGMI